MKTNKEKFPNTDDALAAWKKHREECKCDCKFESWLKQPCDEEIKKYVKNMSEGMDGGSGELVSAGLYTMKILIDLAEAVKEREPKGKPDDAEADDKRDGLKCPLCGGEHGRFGIMTPIFVCPDCGAVISKEDCFDFEKFREWYSGLTK